MQERLDPNSDASRLRECTEQTIREAAETLHHAEAGLRRRHRETPCIGVLRNELQVLEAQEVLQLCRSAAGF